ncbi:ATP-binding cassette domain-containing protein [Acidovorax sp. NPDC077664]|uniref:ATP-binding cassette domain-containing protein n=1 Tax=Acidovorax sp. NPDC077664 TaxID=3390544 RepID=UPI003D078F43
MSAATTTTHAAAASTPAKSNALVQAHDLAKTFDVSAPWLNRVIERKPRTLLHAVDGVSFEIEKGKTLALVGESGCGKSTVARLLVGLYEPTRGGLTFDKQDAHAAFKGNDARAMRRRIQMIFQDPYASLNPRWLVEDIIGEPLKEHGLITDKAELKQRVGELLKSVGLSPLDMVKYPHQFSGGQRQRISIARALATEPEFLVCDEPTSALDVSVQAQVLNIMKDLQRERQLTQLFFSHNLAVVRHVIESCVSAGGAAGPPGRLRQARGRVGRPGHQPQPRGLGAAPPQWRVPVPRHAAPGGVVPSHQLRVQGGLHHLAAARHAGGVHRHQCAVVERTPGSDRKLGQLTQHTQPARLRARRAFSCAFGPHRAQRWL